MLISHDLDSSWPIRQKQIVSGHETGPNRAHATLFLAVMPSFLVIAWEVSAGRLDTGWCSAAPTAG
jgi:hypothetical protein